MPAVIAGELGGLRLPIEPPGRNDSPFPDPALDVLGAYLRAFITAYAGEAWLKIAPKEPIVRNVFTHDPEHHDFKTGDLPALYLFRTGSARDPVDLSQDFRIHADIIQAFWILPTSQDLKFPARLRAIPAVGKLIDTALEVGRDPSWVLQGDPDPTAAEQGSVVLRHAGLVSMLGKQWRVARIGINGYRPMAGPRELELFDCLDLKITIEEQAGQLLGVDPGRPELGAFGGGPLASPSALSLSVSVDGLTVSEALFAPGYAMLYVQDGATAQTIGTTPAKMTGFTAQGISAGLEPDAANDRITVLDAGLYEVSGAFSVLGTAGRVAQLRLRKNDVEEAGIGGRSTLAATAGSLSFAPGLVACEQGDVLTVYAEADVDATSFTPVDGSFLLRRVQ